jgi:signal transduction histidine kinase
MEERMTATEQAEIFGGIVVPAGFATLFALYELIAVDSQSTRGWLLLFLALASVGSTFLVAKFAFASLVPIAFGWFIFGVLGCVGLALALAEQSGWIAIGSSVFALLFGWYTIERARRFRRYVSAELTREP